MTSNREENIMFIVPPNRSYTQRLPLGLMTISSYLTSRGEQNSILDYKGITQQQAFQKIKERILADQPRYIGITCLVAEVEVVRQLSHFIRQFSPGSKIIIGGPYPTICPQHFVDLKVAFDFLVIGEGEITCYELIRALNEKRNVRDVKGIAFVDDDGKLFFTPAAPLISDLDALPFPAYDKVDMSYYARPNVWAIRPVFLSSFNIFTSRGCPYHCNFCVAHTIFGRKMRYMSPERVVEHIRYVVNTFHPDALYFADESFTISRQRISRIFELLRKEGIHILFGCETRVNLVDAEIIKILKENGCIQIDFGIESGSERMLKVMNKQITVAQIKQAGKLCQQAKIRQLANFMFNLPGETLDDLQASLTLINEIKYHVVLWNLYTPWPGVTFGKELDMEDLGTMLNHPSQATYQLLNRKYKFGAYSQSLEDINAMLHKNTFHPKNIRLSLRWSYWKTAFRMISYVTKLMYIRQLLRSKRKQQYFTQLIHQKTKA